MCENISAYVFVCVCVRVCECVRASGRSRACSFSLDVQQCSQEPVDAVEPPGSEELLEQNGNSREMLAGGDERAAVGRGGELSSWLAQGSFI